MISCQYTAGQPHCRAAPKRGIVTADQCLSPFDDGTSSLQAIHTQIKNKITHSQGNSILISTEYVIA